MTEVLKITLENIVLVGPTHVIWLWTTGQNPYGAHNWLIYPRLYISKIYKF